MPDTRLYFEDPSLDRVETEVIETGELEGRFWVRLEATVFHPEGGGQPADRGTIAGVPVLDVRLARDQVLHILERPVGLGPVVARIDAWRRFDLRQQHSAQHLLTAMLADRHALPTTSFHLGEESSTIEIASGPILPERLRVFEDEVNALIREDRRVRTRWVDPAELESLAVRTRGLPEGHAGAVRLVEIEGIDLNTCGGTHVERLGQIQQIHLRDAETSRRGTRIRFLAGGRVLAALWRHQALWEALKSRIGAAPEEFPSILDGWMTERRRLEKRVREIEQALAASEAEALAASAPEGTVQRFYPDATPEFLRTVATLTLRRRPGSVVMLVGRVAGTDEACFLVQSGTEGPEDVADVGASIRNLLGAKGGGTGRVFQGRGGRVPADVERFFRTLGGGQ